MYANWSLLRCRVVIQDHQAKLVIQYNSVLVINMVLIVYKIWLASRVLLEPLEC